MTDTDDQPADTMRERGSRSGLRFRLLVEADRLALVGVLLLVIFLTLVAVGMMFPMRGVFASGDPIETAFQAFVGATITGVTLVVTLNQLVLSQEFGAVGDQRERMDAAVSFREDVESVLDAAISPPEPAAFLRALVEVTGERAGTLQSLVADDETLDATVVERIETLTDDIEANATAVSDGLTDAQFGTFDVVSAALDFDYSWMLYSIRRIQTQDASTLSEEQSDAVDDLVETLQLFGPAREHIKTLYFQWELIALSRVILGASLPSLVVAISMVLFYDPEAISGSVVGVPLEVLLVSGAVAIALVPFLVLLSYVLRIAVVTQRTLSIGPFTLRETDRSEDIDWE